MFERLVARLKGLIRRNRIDAEVEEELRFHLEMEIQANIARGMTPLEARRLASRDLGGVVQTREAVSDVRATFLDTLHQDLRYAVRSARHNRAFTAVAVATLALGIGANTTIFTLVDAVLFRPLPFGDPNRLVWVMGYDGRSGQVAATISPQAYAELARHGRSFDEATCSTWMGPSFTTVEDEPRVLKSMEVCSNFFDVLRVRPLLGRGFLPGDAGGNEGIVVITYSAWQKHFGGDPGILGRSVVFRERPVRVVGIAPPQFVVAPLLSFAQPDMVIAASPPSGRAVAVARLKRDVTVEQAQAEVDAMGRGLVADAGTSWRRNMQVQPLQSGMFNPIRPLSLVLFTAALLVLLLAVVNLANLLVARGSWRQRELAIRAALGAGRGRLVRQLLVEGLLLSAIGGSIGVVLAWISFDALSARVPSRLFVALPSGVDGRVLAFTIVISVAAGLASAILPAMRLTRSLLIAAIHESRRVPGLRTGRTRGAALVVTQMALVVVILTSAGLMLNSLLRALTIDLGVNVEQVVQVSARAPREAWKSAAAVESYYRDSALRLSTVPGVLRVAGVCSLTVGGRSTPWGPMLMNGPPESRGARYLVTADYFTVLGIKVVSGRTFTQQEVESGAPLAVVNEAAARSLWPGEGALGRQFRTGSEPPREVIGVVADTRDSYRSNVNASVYLPPDRTRPVPLDLVALVDGEPSGVAAAIEARVATRSNQVVAESLSDAIRKTTVAERFQALLLSLFAGLALALAAVGIAGIVGYTAARRTQEVGIRLALGASPIRVVSLIIRQSLTLVAAGAVVGVCAALAVAKLLAGLLFQVKPNDPATVAMAVGALLIVGAVAGLVPAMRASRVDPVVVLRTD